MLNSNLVSSPAIQDFQKLEVNFVSLSDMISLGIPCSLNISFMNTLAMSIALQVNFLNLSTTTMIVSLCLVDVGNLVMKSMEMVSHFHYKIGRGCNNPVGCWCSSLTCWHSINLAKYLAMSFFNPGQ